ncbi:hypothetical protein [Myroides sp. N17-2]|uniref:hypothetical protein n=1 Tax=Myroides sp. N17-2 TaxID=2030799 RepID=UPI000EFB76C9|nr:hypothetical protein [Myroides sp. N17-2]
MDLENKKLAFTVNAQRYLNTMAGWGMFISVLGLIGGFMSMGSIVSAFTLSIVFGIFSLGNLFVQVLSAVGLFLFSLKIKSALGGDDAVGINEAFKGLMRYFLFASISILVSFSMLFVVRYFVEFKLF